MIPIMYHRSSWGKEADARGEPTNEMNHQPTTRKVSPKRVVLGSLACLAGLTLLSQGRAHVPPPTHIRGESA